MSPNLNPVINLELIKLLNTLVKDYNNTIEGEQKNEKEKEIKRIADMLYSAIQIEPLT
jgi:hypothetical protein